MTNPQTSCFSACSAHRWWACMPDRPLIPVFTIHFSVHVWVNECAQMRMWVSMFMGFGDNPEGCSWAIVYFSSRQGHLLARSLPSRLGDLLARLMAPPVSASPVLMLQKFTPTGFFNAVLGIKLRFSCLQGRHFIDWGISLAPCWLVLFKVLFCFHMRTLAGSYILLRTESKQEFCHRATAAASLTFPPSQICVS